VTDATPPTALPASLPRRLAAMFYDGLLILALWMIATTAFLPLTGGEALRWSTTPFLFVVHKLLIVSILVGIYGYAWTRQGQTLGMSAWRLRVQRRDGSLLGWGDTVRRIGAAVLSWLPFGLGWLWSLVDREKRTWHDIASQTQVVVLPKRPRH
jgi:uncharacterized RDD family membrane protein YckC